jgi:hypothetical protein
MGAQFLRFGGLHEWGSLCSIVGFLVTGGPFIRSLFEASPGMPLPGGSMRLFTILFLGLVAAVGHGILWSLAERRFGWSFGAGGGTSLPSGRSAVVLSVTMTLPLLVGPFAYQHIAGVEVLPPRYLVAAAAVVVASAFAHVFLYGAAAIRFAGIRNIVFPIGSPPDPRRAVLMEAIYTAVHFSSVVLVYRVIVESAVGPLGMSLLWVTAIPAMVFFFGVNIFVLLRWPDSLIDKTWIQVRGVIAGLLLLITLQGGILM